VKHRPSTPDPAELRRPSHLAALLLGLVAILVLLDILVCVGAVPIALSGHADFRQLYAAGYMVRAGQRHQLYEYEAQKTAQDAVVSREEKAMPFIRPAYQALLFVPFSLLKYQTAYLLFLVVNVGLAAGCFLLLRRRLPGLAAMSRILPAALFMSFLPMSIALMQGQDSIILLFLLAGAQAASDQDREATAGALVGLGLFKFQITLPIAFVFLARRHWRFFRGFGAAATLVTAISVALAGLGETRAFATSLLRQSTDLSSGASSNVLPLGVHMMANLRGLVSALAGEHAQSVWVQAITVVLSIGLLAWIGFTLNRKQQSMDLLPLAITASAVVSYYLFIHDLTVMIIPILLSLNDHITPQSEGKASNRAVAAFAIAVLFSPICLFLSPRHFYLVAIPLIAFLFVGARPAPNETERTTKGT